MLKIRTLLASCALVVIGSAPALAEVKLPNVFGDNMVLQRDREVPVWGTAAPDEAVTVEFAGNKATAKAGADGKWRVALPAMKANDQPQTMTVSAANHVEVKNVLVGEVWVCSGQSNMQWSVKDSNDAAKEIADASHPNIRLFLVPNVAGPAPAADVNAHWAACSPQSVPNFSAVGYYFGRHLAGELKVPVGLIANAWGGQRIERFTPKAGVDAVPELAGKPQGNLADIYNGMVAPIIPYGIRGAIWYQGESNNGDGPLYLHRMKALIEGWRKAWGEGDFPFYYVQIAPLANFYNGEALPLLWEAQTQSLAIPNTGMAVITDIGNLGDIHPRNKQDVGRRLALWALNRTYGRNEVVPSGPLYKSLKIDGDKIRVEFDYVGGGLKARDGKPLAEFEIAGADGKFVPATASIEGANVVVHADSVKEPKHVRFGWRREANPNLMNAEGLPAGPFRSNAEPVAPAAAQWSIKHKLLVFGGSRGAQIIDGDGKLLWKFDHPASDGQLLPNGNVLMALYPSKDRYPTGAIVEVDPAGKVVWEWRGTQQELVTAWVLENGNILTVELGQNPRLLELTREGKIAVSVPLEAQKENIHLQVRMARKLPNGNYIVPQLKEKEIREYAPDGKIVWRAATPNWAFTAIRLDNGHTVVGCTIGNFVAELDGDGKVVWQAGNEDIAPYKLNDACGVQRLPNGNTVMTSYHSDKGVKLVEVTPDKKVVWTFNDGSPHGIHHFQVLDTNGQPLPGRPMR